MERSTIFPRHVAAQGAWSLLQGACLAPAAPGQGGTALVGRWCPAQPMPKGRLKDRVGRKGLLASSDLFSRL